MVEAGTESAPNSPAEQPVKAGRVAPDTVPTSGPTVGL
jgi:hypothetical protein